MRSMSESLKGGASAASARYLPLLMIAICIALNIVDIVQFDSIEPFRVFMDLFTTLNWYELPGILTFLVVAGFVAVLLVKSRTPNNFVAYSHKHP